MPFPLQTRFDPKSLWAILLLLVPSAFAQTPQPGQRIPDGGVRAVLISIFIPSIPDAPFTATVNTESVRQLPDGTRITLRNHRLIARDKSGRIFQERRLLVPDGGQHESVLTQTEISDPVSHQQYICVVGEHACQLEDFEPAEAKLAPGNAQKNAGAPSPETLGTQEIAGLKTEGTREVAVIPAGTIGNDGPLLAKREFWYSPQLGLNLLSIREDPRFGTQRFELSGVTLGEPDSKLFSPPEGLRIIDLRSAEETAPVQSAPKP